MELKATNLRNPNGSLIGPHELQAMDTENLSLVTDEPVGLRKKPFEFQDFEEVYQSFNGNL